MVRMREENGNRRSDNELYAQDPALGAHHELVNQSLQVLRAGLQTSVIVCWGIPAKEVLQEHHGP